MQELQSLKSHEGVCFVVSRSEDDFTFFYDHFQVCVRIKSKTREMFDL